ncbi:protein anon-37Cs-like [Adelges cooleyi]|uniref:protein anon-37Cs-like n=1 Tax=Adelges cooleyi TaxID=133065 RepID=UPI0021808CE9|nr:protein anon-37Cs-like [Adelges cooleyi]
MALILNTMRRFAGRNVRCNIGRWLSLWRGKAKPSEEMDCDVNSTCLPMNYCKLDPSWKQPRVVIVGAGMAGLSAAQHLSMSGIHNFVVLEATNEVGGRIHSTWYGDVMTELGVDSLYGCPSDSVFRLASHERLMSPPLPRIDRTAGGWYVPEEHRQIKDKVVAKAVSRFREIERAAVLAYDEMLNVQRTESLWEWFDERIESELKGYLGDRGELDDMGRVMYAMTNELRTKIGASLRNVAYELYGPAVKLPGGEVSVASGLIGTMAPLIRNIPVNCLKTHQRVATIRWGAPNNTSPRSIVVTEEGVEYPADYVVCTVPLGVLKHSQSLFCPALPAKQWEAIQNLGFANVCKVFARYERPFWLPGTGHMNFAWSKMDLYGSSNDRNHWSRCVSGVHEAPGSSKVLTMTVTDRESLAVETMNEAMLSSEVHELLRRFRGDPHLSPPSQVYATKWSTNPDFRGFRTFMNATSGIGHIIDLATPLSTDCDMPPVIIFAGEHTSVEHYGTVHGSRMTGIRASSQIIESTIQYKGPPFPSNAAPPPRLTNKPRDGFTQEYNK